jgi:hypothetical protein
LREWGAEMKSYSGQIESVPGSIFHTQALLCAAWDPRRRGIPHWSPGPWLHTHRSHRLINQAKNHKALRILPRRKQNPQSRLMCASAAARKRVLNLTGSDCGGRVGSLALTHAPLAGGRAGGQEQQEAVEERGEH